ncbi:nitroreductase [Streptomyces sp. HNM0574]|nr:nitroreductase [Streptomyces sp. HNM0574]
MHNAQPWEFRYHRAARTLELRADFTRSMPHADPDGRGLHIGCGAALLNLRAAACHAGLRPEVRLLPDAADPGLLAEVRFTEGEGADRALAALEPMIAERHTSRYPYAEVPLEAGVQETLVDVAAREGATLEFPTGWHLSHVLQLIQEAEADESYYGDVDEARWLRRGTAESDTAVDGITEPNLGVRKRGGRAPVRDFARGSSDTDRGSAVFEQVPHLALVSTADDGPHAWLRAGQATERALLAATEEGLVGSFATQPLERRDLRWLLRDPVGGAGPVHVVLRVGYGPRGPSSPRRPPGEVLTVLP